MSARSRLSTDHYGSGPSYWDEKYQRLPIAFEWCMHHEHIAGYLEEVLGDRQLRILHVGCGNSDLPAKMYESGYHDMVNIDFSSVVVEQMASKHAHSPGMRWMQMDATCMEFDKAVFDVVLEKSLLDTLVCTPLSERRATVHRYLAEVWRVLRPLGMLLCFSFASPGDRTSYLTDAGFDVVVREFAPRRADTGPTWAYKCTKKVFPDDEALDTQSGIAFASTFHLDELD